jgi:hypothetical protein
MLCAAKPHRGFESHPFRHLIADFRLAISDWHQFTVKLAIGNWQSTNAQTYNHASQLMKTIAFLTLIVVAAFVSSTDIAAQSHRLVRHGGEICGNPKISCKTSATFAANDLPFQVGKNMVIVDTVPFYAVILKSMAAGDDSCDVFIPEADRLAAQELFPENKVFSSRCTDPENLFYADVTSRNPRYFSQTHRIMAVYAGKTLVEAKKMLAAVKTTGKFPGANIRRMRTGFNGT